MKYLGSFVKQETVIPKTIERKFLKEGVNDCGNHFVYIKNDKVVHITDKVCDHAGGRLVLNKEKANCPIHGWELDVESLTYTNGFVQKQALPFTQDAAGNILLEDVVTTLQNPFKPEKKGEVNMRWLNHACLFISCNGKSIITDPWIKGPALLSTWWLGEPSPADSIDLLSSADYIYLSHNHTDHFHAESLSSLPRDKKLLLADFHSGSSEKFAAKMGFTHFASMPFGEIFEITPGFQIAVLKSGDFRDDSGLYVCANGHEFLLAVDCNFLNHLVLPQHIDLLCTSFAGSSSGFPLSYDNFSTEEKSKIVQRNKNGFKFGVRRYIESSLPTYYMPYAGSYVEKADRDKYLRDNNLKNTPEDYYPLAESLKVSLIIPTKDEVLHWKDGTLTRQPLNIEYLPKESIESYLQNYKSQYPWNAEKVIDYFKNSAYVAPQIVQVIPTDESFENPVGAIVLADFDQQVFSEISASDLIKEKEGMKVMQLKVRPEIFMLAVEEKLSWEDLLVSAQLRLYRSPNIYEASFWHHFTNVYIGEENFRYTENCGKCSIIDQNPIWIN